MSANEPASDRKRLDSWKEIAAFFGRDERTVNRWEKERGLPIHRLPGIKGRVYAYADELSAWLAEPRATAPPETATSTAVLQSDELESVVPQAIVGIATSSARGYRASVRLSAIAILVLLAIALFPFHLGASRGSKNVAGLGQQRRGVVLASAPSHNSEAEQLYLQGRYYWNKRTPDDLNKALDYFMQSVVHDPSYAPAYVGLADSYNLLREYSLMPESEAYPRALAAAKKAVELDDQSAEAHASLGFASFFGMWDLSTGEREFRRAIDLDPDDPKPHHWYANALLALHHLPEAEAEIDRAQQLDPTSSAILADKANILLVAGRHDEALSILKQMEGRDPNFRSVHLYLQCLYLRNRDYPNFLYEMKQNALLVHDDVGVAVVTAAEKGLSEGGSQGMFESLRQTEKKLYEQHLIAPTELAWTLAAMGDKKEALQYLKAAYEQRDGALLFVEVFPEFNGLHDQPAYHDLLARMNLPTQDNP